LGFVGGLGILPFLLFSASGIFYQTRDRRMAAELQRLRLGSAASSPSHSLAMATAADVSLNVVHPSEWATAEQPAIGQPQRLR
jgi:hypothetical protein